MWWALLRRHKAAYLSTVSGTALSVWPVLAGNVYPFVTLLVALLTALLMLFLYHGAGGKTAGKQLKWLTYLEITPSKLWMTIALWTIAHIGPIGTVGWILYSLTDPVAGAQPDKSLLFALWVTGVSLLWVTYALWLKYFSTNQRVTPHAD